MSAVDYSAAITAHLDWLSGLDTADAWRVNATRERDSLDFTLVFNTDGHDSETTASGTLTPLGKLVTGYVYATEITPVVSDIVLTPQGRFRIVRVDAVRSIGAAVHVYDVRLESVVLAS